MFSIERVAAKVFILIILIATFTLINFIVPDDEFKLINNEHKMTAYEKFQYTIFSQVVVTDPQIYPNSVKTKILRLTQMLLGYVLIII